jgi:RimJ/RimL family protein N-acetyltransferase
MAPDMTEIPQRIIVRSGERVSIGRHVAADRSSFMAWYQDTDIAELLRHDLAPLNAIQARGYFDSIILPSSNRGLCWAILRNHDDALIGSTALVDLNDRTGFALFRIVIGEKDDWGKGYGTETTQLVLAEAFTRFDRQAVNLEVFAHNPRALRAYQKAGFVQSGQHREWVARASRQIDVLEMRITRDDWLNRLDEPVPNLG